MSPPITPQTTLKPKIPEQNLSPEEMTAFQNGPIPFRPKMKCKSYHEKQGVSFKQLWNWPSIRIFIGIWSVEDKYELRHIIRTLYSKQKQNLIGDNVDFKFILGTPTDDEWKLRLTAENDTYGDLVILDIEENMNNGKAYYYWKWVEEQIDTTQYDYAAKSD